MICLFGGTFDPVHCGHLHAATQVCEELRIDCLRLLLSARPVHRDGPGAAIEQRWEMLQLACDGDPRLLPDDLEIRRDGPSFTVSTLAALKAQQPAETLVWVIGSDAYSLLPQWYEWERLGSLANIVVLKRPGHRLEMDASLRAFTTERQVDILLESAVGQVLVLDNEMQSVSSQQIRTILAAGGSAEHLLPAPVATYISQYSLYGGLSDP